MAHSCPLPPSLPPNTKAPWINVETSSWSTDWGKLVNSQQFSDVVFHLGPKQFHAHKYVLCSASDIMRNLFGVKQKVKSESLSKCKQWTDKTVSEIDFDKVNNAEVEGLLSIHNEEER